MSFFTEKLMNQSNKAGIDLLGCCKFLFLTCFMSVQIPGFMVMQVRYLYEAEGNKKAKDAKAVGLFTSMPYSK